MGNERTLAMIAKAAKKLARLDPDFAALPNRQRRDARDKQRRLAVRALTNEFDHVFKRLIRGCEAEITFDASADVESISAQDAMLVSFDTVISAPRAKQTSTRLRKPVPASERRKARGRRREPRRYTFKDQSRTLKEWSAVTGIVLGTITNRLTRGWSLDEALTVEVGSVMGTHSHKDQTRTARRNRGYSPTSSKGARTSGTATLDTSDKQGFFQSTKP